MAAVDVDVVESALRDVNLSSGREIILKPEQESAVRALLADRDVLAVLPTGYSKSLIYQMFVRAKNYELNGNAAILVISPLKSIIEDRLQECPNSQKSTNRIYNDRYIHHPFFVLVLNFSWESRTFPR